MSGYDRLCKYQLKEGELEEALKICLSGPLTERDLAFMKMREAMVTAELHDIIQAQKAETELLRKELAKNKALFETLERNIMDMDE
ncbi:hypothetical protein DAKH74_051340 [Maudiozyma humilis]|uniref:Uncharacterized protein n=1 Tax=Maudiozyma humilis TaxID=51915 RepID=A0AAV5S4H0_MAUHU|nr:hypothetical protein DAKH74_051340 [Kazachstania humilis]